MTTANRTQTASLSIDKGKPLNRTRGPVWDSRFVLNKTGIRPTPTTFGNTVQNQSTETIVSSPTIHSFPTADLVYIFEQSLYSGT